MKSLTWRSAKFEYAFVARIQLQPHPKITAVGVARILLFLRRSLSGNAKILGFGRRSVVAKLWQGMRSGTRHVDRRAHSNNVATTCSLFRSSCPFPELDKLDTSSISVGSLSDIPLESTTVWGTRPHRSVTRWQRYLNLTRPDRTLEF